MGWQFAFMNSVSKKIFLATGHFLASRRRARKTHKNKRGGFASREIFVFCAHQRAMDGSGCGGWPNAPLI
jgi:hypothetical protein